MFKKCTCWYCTNFGYPLLWQLDTNLYWFEICKNGSYATRQTFPNRKFIEDRTTINKTIHPYAVVRHPEERFLSLFKHYMIEGEHRFTIQGKPFFERIAKKPIEDTSLEYRLDFLCENLSELSSLEEVHHFHTQTSYIDSSFDVNYIPLDRLTAELGVLVMNSTKEAQIKLGPKHIDLVKDVYKQDYELLQYV